MKYVPVSLSRFAHRTALKLSAKSPTILVVTGVVGLGATAVMAAKATRKIDPVLDAHAKARIDLEVESLPQRQHNKALLDLYVNTGWKLGKIYGPSIIVGTGSAVSVLGGHRILVGRHVASMAAYSGLFNEFRAYRARVARAFGEDQERAIAAGGTAEWVEDPNHKGEYKLEGKYPEERDQAYLQPWIEPPLPIATPHPAANFAALSGVEHHMNKLLDIRGVVFLNEALEALGMARVPDGQIVGWLKDKDQHSDGFIDFGFRDDRNPNTAAFIRGETPYVQLNFNVDGNVWSEIADKKTIPSV